MRQIRLAVIFDQEIHVGGGYQQSINALMITQKLPEEVVEIKYFTTIKENIIPLSDFGIKVSFIKISFFDKLFQKLKNKINSEKIFKIVKKISEFSSFENILLKNKIDLVYFLSPCELAKSLERINYIVTVWDLCHRDEVEFPEVRWNKKLESRDNNLFSILPKATAILVDSELGKSNIIHRYCIDEHRIFIMPFQAGVSTRKKSDDSENKKDINICEKYNLNYPYIFYPAQFWPHKNHIYILNGLVILEEKFNIKIGAIFSGGNKGNQDYIEKSIKNLKLEDRVKIAGFVSNDEIPCLYKQSIGLVMPTYFGPTNLPPLEAFELGIPVLYTNAPGMKNQVEEAALLIDLMDPFTMANSLKSLIESSLIKERLINLGNERLSYFNSINREEILLSIIERYRWKRICWE
jgi:glycosyltransferase involved in cell wall biosynthesis